MGEKKLDVPYYSQYTDLTDKDQRLVACGMTCVHMALSFYGKAQLSLDELVATGMREGGFGSSGWLHDYLVSVFTKAGISCERREQMQDRDVDDVRGALDEGNPVIISGVRRFFDRRIFHQVILVGYRESDGGKLDGFYYHDPAALRAEDGQDLYAPLGTFLLDWRRMAIFPGSAGVAEE